MAIARKQKGFLVGKVSGTESKDDGRLSTRGTSSHLSTPLLLRISLDKTHGKALKLGSSVIRTSSRMICILFTCCVPVRYTLLRFRTDFSDLFCPCSFYFSVESPLFRCCTSEYTVVKPAGSKFEAEYTTGRKWTAGCKGPAIFNGFLIQSRTTFRHEL